MPNETTAVLGLSIAKQSDAIKINSRRTFLMCAISRLHWCKGPSCVEIK